MLAFLLCFAPDLASSESISNGNSACSVLKTEVTNFLEEKRAAGSPTDGPDNPIIQIITDVTADLDDLPRARIRTPLMSAFASPCMMPEQFDLSPETTVDEAIDFVLNAYGLDRTLPEWGLVELPEVDFETQSCLDIAVATSELPDEVVFNPFNDLFRAYVDLFWEDYDLSATDAREKQANAINMMMFEEQAMSSGPCAELMARLAENQGLQKKAAE